MSSMDQFEQRLAAVERTVVDGDHDVAELSDLETLTETIDTLTEAVVTLENRVLTLESGLEALEGYVGNIQSVNQSVERQADIAIVSAGRVEDRLNKIEGEVSATTITNLSQRIMQLESELAAVDERMAAAAAEPDGFDDFVFEDESARTDSQSDVDATTHPVDTS